MKHIKTFESFLNEGRKHELKVFKSSLNDALALLRKEDIDFQQMPGKPAEDFVVINFATADELEVATEILGAQKNRKSFLSEAKTQEFELEIINKNGKNTVQKVQVDPASTELFSIIANLKKSPNVKDVKIIEK